VQPDGDFLAYPNYLDPALTPEEAADLYYGPATYDKLVKIKRDVDPEAVFWNPQAIGNAVL
jgi:FAD/FMN-containing dehydrogenase